MNDIPLPTLGNLLFVSITDVLIYACKMKENDILVSNKRARYDFALSIMIIYEKPIFHTE